MGAQESTLGGGGGDTLSSLGPSNQSPFGIGGPDRFGFQVLRVDPSSPSSQCGLEAFFDYIVAVNGSLIIAEKPNLVAEVAKANVDKEVKLTLYNSREDSIRETIIVPSRSWEGNTLLGAGIRFSKASGITDRNWHILSCSPNSPAEAAGFIPEKDWIIGCVDISLNSSEDFYHLMAQNLRRDVPLYVYNIDDDSIRILKVRPDFQWGGDGCLGADVASGALHRIPSKEQRLKDLQEQNEAPPQVIQPVAPVGSTATATDSKDTAVLSEPPTFIEATSLFHAEESSLSVPPPPPPPPMLPEQKPQDLFISATTTPPQTTSFIPPQPQSQEPMISIFVPEPIVESVVAIEKDSEVDVIPTNTEMQPPQHHQESNTFSAQQPEQSVLFENPIAPLQSPFVQSDSFIQQQQEQQPLPSSPPPQQQPQQQEKEETYKSPSMDPIACFENNDTNSNLLDFAAMLSSTSSPPPPPPPSAPADQL